MKQKLLYLFVLAALILGMWGEQPAPTEAPPAVSEEAASDGSPSLPVRCPYWLGRQSRFAESRHGNPV